jgi:hypothetical protein
MRIFVGGLPRTATKDEVVRLFRQFGADDDAVVLPRDRRTRRRKGIAYVEIADSDAARAAIALFAGFTIEGKPLTVCAADERPPKRGRRKLAVVLALCATGLGIPAGARADETSTRIGLTLNPIIGGLHESYDDLVHVRPVPIPLIEVRHVHGPVELDLEGLPPVASVRYDDTLQGGHTSTRLSIFDGFVRVWDPLHRFSAGLGQTLYNQSTHYTHSVEIAGTGETQFSRVTGLTYTVGYGIPLHRGRFEAIFNYAPAMRGVQYTIYDISFYRPRINPERAGQIDTAARFVHPLGARSEIVLGVRYVNYTASYDQPSGGLSDRNVGLLPVIGYLTRIGR